MKKDPKLRAVLVVIAIIIVIFCLFMFATQKLAEYRAQKSGFTQRDSLQTNIIFENTWSDAFDNEEDL